VSFSLADVSALSEVAAKVDPNPISLAGRVIGLTPEEQEAGVPVWAWVSLGVLTGGVLGVLAYRRWAGGDFLRRKESSG
jgi:hypothetical protein